MRPALFHYSNAPLITVHSVEQPEKQEGWGSPYKPQGLWLSVDGEDDWPSWCRSETFALEKLAKRYRIDLTDAESLLWITTDVDLLDFTERYDKRLCIRGHDFSGHYLDWQRVAREYPGMVIAPYQWELRLDPRTHWYYGWDCASGCIWDAGVISRIEESPVSELDEQA